ncbi:hypothetical protein [Sporolactobacillus terrae]|uniref:hypothetical protein n=1 Tax=Sporolactobacillus terrae TaxID=269673 RepID=UPI001CC18CED|nr:hypothetical protein [Sporolactobacillus terrae]UAK17553.1 hypothetical protein K7399_06400 [Sporolactobacillus terrae]
MAPLLGGRSEVLITPMVELFKYLELEMKKDKVSAREHEYERYFAFISQCMASPYADPDKREEFRQSLMPREVDDRPKVEQKWNFEMLERLKSKQKGGGKPHGNS